VIYLASKRELLERMKAGYPNETIASDPGRKGLRRRQIAVLQIDTSIVGEQGRICLFLRAASAVLVSLPRPPLKPV
jgi:hypothetical protein